MRKVQVVFKGMPEDNQVRRVIEERALHLPLWFQNIEGCNVIVRSAPAGFRIDLKLTFPSHTLCLESKRQNLSQDVFLAVSDAFRAATQQLALGA